MTGLRFDGVAISSRLDAVVFDLDGTIVDTEAVVYRSIAAVFEEHGLDFSADRWARLAIGQVGHFDWRDELAERATVPVDRAAATALQTKLELEMMTAAPVRPGVVALVEELAALGIPMSVASNSRTGWVRKQLDRVNLVHHFSALYGRDRVPHPKPEPDLYEAASRDIGAEPAWTVGIEDSEAGLTSALAAGLVTVACPNQMTQILDFSAAHLRVPSLDEVDVARLCTLIEQVHA